MNKIKKVDGNMTIKTAQLNSLEELINLYANHLSRENNSESVDKIQAYKILKSMIEDKEYKILVAREEYQIVSSVTLLIVKNLTHNLRPYAIIENVVTHEKFRKKGYARALIKEACEMAAKNNCYKITLTTGSKDPDVLQFYENCGFNRNDKTAFIKWL